VIPLFCLLFPVEKIHTLLLLAVNLRDKNPNFLFWKEVGFNGKGINIMWDKKMYSFGRDNLVFMCGFVLLL
jgi:hypothetical protein